MLVLVYIGGARPPLFAGIFSTPHTGMHSRTVLLAPPFGPSNSDESQQPTIAADVCSRTRSRQTGRAPRGDTTARAPLWPRFPERHRRGGGLTVGEREHPVTAPGLLAGCILEAAAHPGEGGGTDHTLHGRARRPGRSPRIAQLPRSTSTQGAPPALTAAVAAPPPCRPPREFVRRRPRLLPGLATGAPGRRRRGRPSEGEGSVSDGRSPPRAPLPIVPPRRHHARTLGEGRFT